MCSRCRLVVSICSQALDITSFVLTLALMQTARALLKMLYQFRSSGAIPVAMEFLKAIDQPRSARSFAKEEWLNPQTHVAVCEQRFLHLLRELEAKVGRESSVAAGIQKHSMHCYKTANAYTCLMLVKNFADAVHSDSPIAPGHPSAAKTTAVLRQLCSLFALTQIDATAGEFLESGCVASTDMPVIRAIVEELLPQLREHAVTLVDGFNFSERALNSVLGRYDGNVYEALYESAQLDPLNNAGAAAASGDVALRELLVPIRNEMARQRGQSRL